MNEDIRGCVLMIVGMFVILLSISAAMVAATHAAMWVSSLLRNI